MCVEPEGANKDDVRKISLALPGVTERPSWGQPAWVARTLKARMRDSNESTHLNSMSYFASASDRVRLRAPRA